MGVLLKNGMIILIQFLSKIDAVAQCMGSKPVDLILDRLFVCLAFCDRQGFQ